MLELEGSNFPVIFDVWSQVVERCATPPEDIRDLLLKLEDDLLKNLTSGTAAGGGPCVSSTVTKRDGIVLAVIMNLW